MPRYDFDMTEMATKAAGAAITGVGRSMVAAKVNPAQKGLPVAKAAYWYDGLSALAGLALVAIGQGSGNATLEELGQGVMFPGVAGLAGDLAHDVNRKWNPQQPAPQAPEKVMQTQAAPAQVMAASAAAPIASFGGSEY